MLNADQLMEEQIQLEELFNKNQLMTKLRGHFNSEEYGIAEHAIAHDIDPVFALDVVVQLALHKRADLQTMVGCLRSLKINAQDVVDELVKCAEADLCDYDTNFSQFITVLEIPADVQYELDLFQYPLPCLVKPSHVKNNMQNGYHVVSKGSVILRNNHHSDDVCLDHINRMNKVKFVFNLDVVENVKNTWRNLDKPKEGEEVEEYEKRVRAFEKYDRTSREVIEHIVECGNEFYLTHKYDKRGRTYCQGYHASYQGAPWNKGCIEFAAGEIVPL